MPKGKPIDASDFHDPEAFDPPEGWEVTTWNFYCCCTKPPAAYDVHSIILPLTWKTDLAKAQKAVLAHGGNLVKARDLTIEDSNAHLSYLDSNWILAQPLAEAVDNDLLSINLNLSPNGATQFELIDDDSGSADCFESAVDVVEGLRKRLQM